jgi:ATP-dependent Clp protease adaptor protein ClpS
VGDIPTVLNINTYRKEYIMSKEDTKTTQKIEIRNDLTPPSLYNVIFLNDNVTTVEFVIAVLVGVFDYTNDEAVILCQKVHEEGAAVVAIYPYELAEQKALETTLMARNNNFPLMVKIEAND